MSLGPKTAVIDGNRVTVPTYDSFNPVGFGQTVQVQPTRQLTVPPMLSGVSAGSQAMYPEDVGGYGTAGNNWLATQVAGNNPWSFRVSPTPWVILGLIVSLVLLSKIHWRATTLGGGRENLHLGGASEEAAAEA